MKITINVKKGSTNSNSNENEFIVSIKQSNGVLPASKYDKLIEKLEEIKSLISPDSHLIFEPNP